ncbi:hypothetical protein RHGRI_000440 [Rhododendron griersonianum]|uniref:Uncharacterized protein n=1 Tax=Rhododendron griersonianum TaxID=479676 RepID=A0AAV6LIS3_9ERIC|nr:hypothetical protein RHGRI_000440 [Rhododendron griersonianum]
MASNSIFESRSSERQWVNQISKIIDEEVRVEIIDIPVSIFRVPTTISAFKPKAYTPQLIGLGPYHRFRPELYEMERYKVAAATRVQKEFKSLEFKQLVDVLSKVENSVRACYHKFLDIDDDTLAWIMAIDGLFLLDFLNSYVNKKDRLTSCTTTALLADASGKNLAQSEILGDIVMLENQIPIFVLSKILTIQTSRPDVRNNLLPSMLMGFCQALSPLKLREDLPLLSRISDHSHLLDLLYHLIVPEILPGTKVPGNGEQGGAFNVEGQQNADSGNSTTIFVEFWNLFSNLTIFSKFTKPIRVVIGLPWKYITGLLGISKGNETSTPEGDEENKTPKVEEIMIPSVSNLRDVGVEFFPTSGDITSIRFDKTTGRFYLPVVTLNVNSEVVMRNLVAYEASIASESLVLARYTELMNGIIDTAGDATLLREKKIIVNSLKSDAEVSELFNGMSKSVRLTNVSYIDKAIGDANSYFFSSKKVRVYTSMKKYVYGSWRFLTIVAVILIILMTALQSFCSVYTCDNIYVTTSS